jgi:DNA-binding response OmpR family regulator
MKCPCCGGDMPERDPTVYGETLRLSKQERLLFDRLCASFARWVSGDALIVALYSDNPDGGPLSAPNAVAASIKGLRAKLTNTDLWIETMPGRGNGDRRLLWRQQKMVKALLTVPVNNGASLSQEARH